jgi:hypothetical protein
MFILLCDDIRDSKSLILGLFIPRCDHWGVKSNGFVGS